MRWWPMMIARGMLGILLGLAVLLWPALRLGELVILFGTYALLDGILAAAWAVGGWRRPFDAWPVLLEGIFSGALGVIALGYPFQSSRILQTVVLWGLVTGVLEIVGAVRCVRGIAAQSCLFAAGVWSIFLAVLVLSLPHALTEDLMAIVGVYTLVFGILVSIAAFTLRRRLIAPVLVAPIRETRETRETWTAR